MKHTIYICIATAFLLGCHAPSQQKMQSSSESTASNNQGNNKNFIIPPFYKASLTPLSKASPVKSDSATIVPKPAPKSNIVSVPSNTENSRYKSNVEHYEAVFAMNRAYISDGFDYPVGKPNGNGYFKALHYGQRGHLGEDWNGVGGGASDLGAPVYSVSNGIVTEARALSPELRWGKIVRVIYKMPEGVGYAFVEGVYAHLNDIDVQVGELVQRGQQLGTIGDADGLYSPHLHFEMRYLIDMPLGGGYSKVSDYGHIAPSDYIKSYRPPLK